MDIECDSRNDWKYFKVGILTTKKMGFIISKGSIFESCELFTLEGVNKHIEDFSEFSFCSIDVLKYPSRKSFFAWHSTTLQSRSEISQLLLKYFLQTNQKTLRRKNFIFLSWQKIKLFSLERTACMKA